MPHIIVTAAVIERDDTFLVTRRSGDVHLAGLWEFPGGKVEMGESLENGLRREVQEELGCSIDVHELLLDTRHEYERVCVHLHFFRATLRGEPVARLGQQMQWVPRGTLRTLGLPEADAALVNVLDPEPRGTACRAPTPEP